MVVGNAEDLAKIDEVLIDDVDVTNASSDMETSVALAEYLPSEISIADGTEEIMIKVMIEQLQEKTIDIENDDINIVGKKDGYTYTFTNKDGLEIKVKGLKDKLSDIKVANMLPSIDVSEYGTGKYTFTVSLKEDSGVTIEGEYTVELEIGKE